MPAQLAVWLSVVLIASLQPADLSACVIPPGEYSENLDEVAQRIETLWSGTWDERRAITASPSPQFHPFTVELTDEEQEQAAEQIESLRLWIDAEKDDWLVSSLLRGIRGLDMNLLDLLFLQALTHPSPNVRRSAVERFVVFRRPDALELLEKMWLDETDPGLRLNLALALACHGSEEPTDALAEWLHSDEALLQETATRALRHTALPDALNALTSLALSSGPGPRPWAVRALAAWPQEASARAAVIHASRSKDPVMIEAAIHTLAEFADEQSLERLVELAVTEGPDGKTHEREVLVSLAWLPRSIAGSAIERIEGQLDADYADELREQSSWISSRPRPSVDRDSCGQRPMVGSPEIASILRAAPPPDRRTIRCWNAPLRSGDPLYRARVEPEEELHFLDYHLVADETWVSFYVMSDFRLCWAPLSELDASEDEIDDVAPRRDGSLRAEFDLPLAELATSEFEILRAAGLLSVIDVDARVAGVELRIDPRHTPSVETLARAVAPEDRLLDGHLLLTLRSIEPAHRDNEGVKQALKRATGLSRRMEFVLKRLQRRYP